MHVQRGTLSDASLGLRTRDQRAERTTRTETLHSSSGLRNEEWTREPSTHRPAAGNVNLETKVRNDLRREMSGRWTNQWDSVERTSPESESRRTADGTRSTGEEDPQQTSDDHCHDSNGRQQGDSTGIWRCSIGNRQGKRRENRRADQTEYPVEEWSDTRHRTDGHSAETRWSEAVDREESVRNTDQRVIQTSRDGLCESSNCKFSSLPSRIFSFVEDPMEEEEGKKVKQIQNELDDYKLKLTSKQIEINTLKFDLDHLKQEMNDRLSLLTTNFSTEQMNQVLSERDQHLNELTKLRSELPELKQQMIDSFQTKVISFKEQVKKSLMEKEQDYRKRIEQMENEYIAQYEQVLEKNKQVVRAVIAAKQEEFNAEKVSDDLHFSIINVVVHLGSNDRPVRGEVPPLAEATGKVTLRANQELRWGRKWCHLLLLDLVIRRRTSFVRREDRRADTCQWEVQSIHRETWARTSPSREILSPSSTARRDQTETQRWNPSTLRSGSLQCQDLRRSNPRLDREAESTADPSHRRTSEADRTAEDELRSTVSDSSGGVENLQQRSAREQYETENEGERLREDHRAVTLSHHQFANRIFAERWQCEETPSHRWRNEMKWNHLSFLRCFLFERWENK